jgi:hypothetical protein
MLKEDLCGMGKGRLVQESTVRGQGTIQAVLRTQDLILKAMGSHSSHVILDVPVGPTERVGGRREL